MYSYNGAVISEKSLLKVFFHFSGTGRDFPSFQGINETVIYFDALSSHCTSKIFYFWLEEFTFLSVYKKQNNNRSFRRSR